MRIRDVVLFGEGDVVDVVVADDAVHIESASGLSARRRVLLPGLVDLHTHLREPGAEESETIASGTAAAAAGGYSDVFAMANTTPPADTVDRVLDVRRRAAGAPARVHVVAAGTSGLCGVSPVDVAALADVGVRVFSDDGRCVFDDDVMRELMARIADADAVFAQHAQHPGIVGDGVVNERVADRVGAAPWPARGESDIVACDIEIVRETGGHLHVCHVSTCGTVELVAQAKREGLPVTAEVTPHHLHLTDEDAARRGPELKVNPPLRSSGDVAALRAALRDGIIDAVGTDHAPHPRDAKRLGWAASAFGLTGIETALAAVAEALTDAAGTVDWRRLIDAMRTRPARIGGISPSSPASLSRTFTVVAEESAPVTARAMLSRSQNSPFIARRFRWRPVLTVLDGRMTFRSE